MIAGHSACAAFRAARAVQSNAPKTPVASSKVGTKPAAFTYVMKYFRVAAFDLFPCLTAQRGDGARGAAPLS